MTDKDFRKLDPIVPTRDDYSARRPVAEKKSARPERASPPPTGSGGKSGGGVWKLLTLLLLLSVAGLGAFSWQQQQILADLGQRFESLASRIESTDESLNQSGAALGIKIKDHTEALDKHWSEIKKLWGVAYDTNRKAIASNTESLESQTGTLKKAEQSLKTLQAKVAQVEKSFDTVRGSALSLTAQLEEQQDRLLRLGDSVTKLEKSMQQWQGKLAENDGAFDAYRRQINQQLAQIRQTLGLP
jgi:chromosome segregation ATPase